MLEADPTAPVITLDGPTASGKGTIAQSVAHRLGWHYLDSGALYRLVALLALRAGLEAAGDEAELVELARGLQPWFHAGRILLAENDSGDADKGPEGAAGAASTEPPAAATEGAGPLSIRGYEDVSEAIRQEAVGQMASRIAILPVLRAALLDLQHSFRQAPGLVADGRDMGTVVFADAQVKVFLTASAESRAERRHKQLIEKGIPASLDDLLRDLKERDKRDSGRAASPLIPAQGAYVLDSTALDIDQTVQAVLDEARRRGVGRQG